MKREVSVLGIEDAERNLWIFRIFSCSIKDMNYYRCSNMQTPRM